MTHLSCKLFFVFFGTVMNVTFQCQLNNDLAEAYYLHSFVLQAEVYDKCVEPLVKSCMEGYNVTVFAYGQTVSNFHF